MAKGSVRKKGKKWYYRFYVENESGNLVQKEYAGTESKSETEALLRKAMEDYEAKKFVARSENVTVGDLLDMWIEEEVKPGNLSNGTVMAYQGAVGRIKQFPIGSRKLKTVTSEHLQMFFDLLSFGGTNADGTKVKPISKGYMRQFSAVMQGAFRFAVFPKRLITFNPMQYIKIRQKQECYELFNEDSEDGLTVPTISYDQFKTLTDYLKKKDNPALLPIQIAYYTGLRIGEVCALTWQDIDLKEQTITVRRSMRYNGARHKTEVGTTKRSKIRTVVLAAHLQYLRRVVAEQQRGVGKVQAGIILLKAGQDAGSLVQRDDGQLHIRGNGSEIDFTRLFSAVQNRVDASINGDFLGTDVSGSKVHRRFLQNFCKIKDPELGLLVQSAISALLPASSVLPVAFLVATGRAA